MIGGRRESVVGAQREKYRFNSFQVREGDLLNTDVTAPGATLALGLMFLGTGNRSVAAWMDPPDTHAVLDTVRPDLLLLRVVARALVMWDNIEPTINWMFKQFPKWIRDEVCRPPEKGSQLVGDPESFSYVSGSNIPIFFLLIFVDSCGHCIYSLHLFIFHRQAYCNILAGSALSMGLRYAGTQHQKARSTLNKVFRMFLKSGKLHLISSAGKPTVEQCLVLTLLASSLVKFSLKHSIEIIEAI